jgi:DNA-binding CsgD family transcriptional regulator
VLDRQLKGALAGRSAVQVLRGEAGVGKSALLAYVAERASACRIVRAAGVESEMELAFAGVHQLCAPLLNGLDRLPIPQQAALRVAFGLQDGDRPDRFLVALAVLSLLAEAAEASPLACLIDDAQWLDRASLQTFAFVARRLLAERIAMIFVVRTPAEVTELSDLPELEITGIADADARLLLASAVPGRLDERVRDRILAETRGNPLALLELPRGMTPAELAGGFGLSTARPLASRLQQTFLERVRALPDDSRSLLLIAAAEPVGDVGLLWRVARQQGIQGEAGRAAEAAALIELGVRVRFRHPLVRSAAYWAAAPHERRDVHRALAEATDPHADPDRRAWHQAQATSGPDEAVAAELERSADRAHARGGMAAAAAFLERAADLTPDPVRQGERALAAAQAKLEAGAPEAADTLLANAALTPLDDLQRARLQRLQAQIAFVLRRGSDAPSLLLAAAQRLADLDVDLARETCLEALGAAIFAGRIDDTTNVHAILGAAPAPQTPRPQDLLLDGLATRVTEGYAAGVDPLRAALEAFRRADASDAASNRWLWLACRIAADLFDEDTWDVLARRGVQLARETGALSVLPIAATYRAGVHMHNGEFEAASTLMEESAAITHATRTAALIHPEAVLAAQRGNETEALALIAAGRRDATDRGQGMALSMLGYAHAVLLNGQGRYEEARIQAEQACGQGELSLFTLALVELIEAAVRTDRTPVAAAALDRLSERAQASGSDWALGVEARSRALLADGPLAEALYTEAVDRLARGRVTQHLARAQLVYGEWLRREHRRQDARTQLRAAYDTFSRIGARAFAERARRELQATGETLRSRAVDMRDALTPQEAQIAGMARDGLTNPEIGAQLFISPRTVEYHLRKVFLKLDVGSRRELTHALSDRPGQAA